MRRIVLTALLILLSITGYSAGGRNGERRNEFELSMGATIGTHTLEEMENWPFLSFAFEWRHLFRDGTYRHPLQQNTDLSRMD